jgi:DNA-binding MarR family transcriptional regulator
MIDMSTTTRAPVRWLDDREQAAWRSVVAFMRALASGMEQQLAAEGVSGADFQLLVPLSEGPAGGLRARDLGVAVGWDRSRLSHQLRRMQQRGLVSRGSCSDDARGIVVQITPAGRELVERVAPGHVAWVRQSIFEGLTAEQIDTFAALCQQLSERVSPGPGATCDDSGAC